MHETETSGTNFAVFYKLSSMYFRVSNGGRETLTLRSQVIFITVAPCLIALLPQDSARNPFPMCQFVPNGG